MKTKNKNSLTFHNGQFRASIGYELKGDGQRKPKVFMLGSDERIAKIKADSFRTIWKNLKDVNATDGKQACWSPFFLDYAMKLYMSRMSVVEDSIHEIAAFNTQSQSAQVVAAFHSLGSDAQRHSPSIPDGHEIFRQAKSAAWSPDQSTSGQKLMLSAAMEMYKEHLINEVRSNERSRASLNRKTASLRVVLKNVSDQPLNGIGYTQISDAIAAIKHRSVNGYAVDTITTTIKDMRAFFSWLEDTGKWKPDFNFSKVCRAKSNKLYTLSEKKQRGSGQKIFTPDELATIYAAATSNTQKLYILLGLNLAATQAQISDLVMDDINLQANPPHVRFIRSKTIDVTGTVGYYELWPETVALLSERIKRTPKTKEGWALLTKDGAKMVYFKEANGSRCDCIYRAWKKLLDKTELQKDRQLSFKYLRKTASDMVRKLAGEAVQKQMLAHANTSMATRHYTGEIDPSEFDKLSKTIHQIRTEKLWKMFGLPEPKPLVLAA
jgi:hypothetical protein